MTKAEIGKAFKKSVRGSRAAAEIASTAKTYADAQKYAQTVGPIVSKILQEVQDGDDFEELAAELLKLSHGNVAGVSASVQRAINQEANIGLTALTPEFDAARAVGLADELMNGGAGLEEIINNLMHIVDETARINMEAQWDSGLVCRITRTYDDVGVHDGKDPCQWCLDREGTWDDYGEALDAGVFERHPGCGCRIEYHVRKTHTVQEGRDRRWRNMGGGGR